MGRAPENQGLYEKRNEHDACGVGAVVNINGKREHTILERANEILLNLHHRGAAAADEITGDGAGILFQIPYEFLTEEAQKLGITLPEKKSLGVGMLFLPKDKSLQKSCLSLLTRNVESLGMHVVGLRSVPTTNKGLGEIALSAEPAVTQIFIDGGGIEEMAFERKLYIARKKSENQIKDKYGEKAEDFYACSFSCKTICYKGMFMAHQLFAYYPDLSDERMVSALAVVHQRYSTNTFPSWKLAQPFRAIAHNGEINTLRGNRNYMSSRELNMESELFGKEIESLFPILSPDDSDSASFDSSLELLVHGGRSMPHSMMMMVPEAFGPTYHMSADKRAFYEYHSSFMEPWDGPSAILFTDGRIVGGTLDRNGLRPCRYVITKDDTLVMASEVGVIEFAPEDIRQKGRLQPGKMFIVDTQEKRVISDVETKSKVARQKPYRRWLSDNRIELRGLFQGSELDKVDSEKLYEKMRCFGYTREEMRMILAPMAINGQEPIGSMGNDVALSVLSDSPKSLFSYFKQMFAQVTNPPIDPLREGLVMSLMSFIGKKRNILSETPEHCKQLKIPHPFLTNEDIQRLRSSSRKDFTVATVSAVFDPHARDLEDSLRVALDRLLVDTKQAISDGASIIIISDRDVDENNAPIPILLASSAVHQGLLKSKLRGEAGIVIESGEPREVNHFSLLCGFGADAVNPYLAIDAMAQMQGIGDIPANLDGGVIVDNYIAAIKKGILKTMSKMGISTLRSYRSAQLFEAIGINKDLIDEFFTGTSSRIGGISLAEIAKDAAAKHRSGFEYRDQSLPELDFGGEYSYRDKGEKHMWTPEAVVNLQHSVWNNDKAAYQRFSKEINDHDKNLCVLRGLFKFKPTKSIDISEVEPASEIVKRFCTGAMSHGSISREAHECMAIAMNSIGAMSNTGEGGENPSRYKITADGEDKNCAIKQVASGRFGVTINYLTHAKEIQIKMAQGAKPGEGGHLPGHKVTQEIATLRNSMPGVSLISPPPHHDIYSIEDLAQLIYDLKCSNPGVKVSVKLVSEVGVGTIAAGVAKGNADEVLIAGGEGGSGATPLSSIKHAGVPWELGLAETQQVLLLNGLRDRIRVQTDGQLRTGRDVVVAALLGAEQFGFGTSAIVSLGCVLMRKCHLGTCPAGIATQNTSLRDCFNGKPEHLVRYMMFIAEEVREIMAELGFAKLEDMVGHVELLEMKEAIDHWKAQGLDLSAILHKVEATDSDLHLTKKQTDKLQDHIDWKLIEKAKPAIENGEKVVIETKVRNQNRAFTTILSSTVAKAHGPKGLPDDTIVVNAHGSAGQSCCAFLSKGITVRIVGQTNDYLGKGMSGGKIVVKVPDGSTFLPHENIIAGNTLLYGATGGEVFINGVAGERFAVRNSGATAVVEGVGDHGCEYMTNGTVVVIGSTGRNFAAGMSGGIAYVFDKMQLFDTLCNLDMVDIECVWQEEDKKLLRSLITKHIKETDSAKAKWILDNWDGLVGRFVKVIPIDYRRALDRLRDREQRESDSTPATEEVYK